MDIEHFFSPLPNNHQHSFKYHFSKLLIISYANFCVNTCVEKLYEFDDDYHEIEMEKQK